MDPNKVLPPHGNCILIALRVEDLRDRISFALRGDFLLNGSYSSVAGELAAPCTHRRMDLRRELLNCLEHGLAQFI